MIKYLFIAIATTISCSADAPEGKILPELSDNADGEEEKLERVLSEAMTAFINEFAKSTSIKLLKGENEVVLIKGSLPDGLNSYEPSSDVIEMAETHELILLRNGEPTQRVNLVYERNDNEFRVRFLEDKLSGDPIDGEVVVKITEDWEKLFREAAE